VAQELGWTEVYLNRRVRGIVPFDVTDLGRLAELLEVPITTFFERPNITRHGVSSVTRRPALLRLAAAA
jgi:transcriptional regulator with XRE-family HTH domain